MTLAQAERRFRVGSLVRVRPGSCVLEGEVYRVKLVFEGREGGVFVDVGNLGGGNFTVTFAAKNLEGVR